MVLYLSRELIVGLQDANLRTRQVTVLPKIRLPVIYRPRDQNSKSRHVIWSPGITFSMFRSQIIFQKVYDETYICAVHNVSAPSNIFMSWFTMSILHSSARPSSASRRFLVARSIIGSAARPSDASRYNFMSSSHNWQPSPYLITWNHKFLGHGV